MQAICGYIRLDRAPLPGHVTGSLLGKLCPNPGLKPRHHTLEEDHLLLGYSQWGGWAAPGEDMLLHDGISGCSVVADARLDECRRLAKELGMASSDKSCSPARLILQAWLRWGADCADHLRGDFAFALWDKRRRIAMLARDIMGVRPLYIHHQPGKLLAFASRADALIAAEDVPSDINLGRIADALVTELEGVDKTSTFYQHVKRLPPAHWAHFTPNKSQQRLYWQPAAHRVEVPSSAEAWVTAFADALETAVQRHLHGPAQVGSMLSGGMDSSALAAIAAEQRLASGQTPLATFSSVSNDPAEPETAAIHAMLGHPGLAPVLLGPAHAEQWRSPLLDAAVHADEPFDSAMALLHIQYRAAAQANVDALLDGIDADMLLSEGSALIRQLRHLRWHAAWCNLRGLKAIHPALSTWRYLLVLARAAAIPTSIRRHLRRDRLGQQTRSAIEQSLIEPAFAEQIHLRDRLHQLNGWSTAVNADNATSQAARALSHPYTTCGLERYHRVAAWHGVQARHPFTDRDLLDLCVNLPDEQRLADGWTKIILRKAMRNRLPEAVCWRRGKEHLGWALTKQLHLQDAPSLRRTLANQRELLAPFIDLSKLDAAMKRATSARDPLAQNQILRATALGNWLLRRDQASSSAQTTAAADSLACVRDKLRSE